MWHVKSSIVSLVFLSSVPMHAMHNPSLTITELDAIHKEEYLALSDEKKWELHESARELIREQKVILKQLFESTQAMVGNAERMREALSQEKA